MLKACDACADMGQLYCTAVYQLCSLSSNSDLVLCSPMRYLVILFLLTSYLLTIYDYTRLMRRFTSTHAGSRIKVSRHFGPKTLWTKNISALGTSAELSGHIGTEKDTMAPVNTGPSHGNSGRLIQQYQCVGAMWSCLARCEALSLSRRLSNYTNLVLFYVASAHWRRNLFGRHG